MSSIMNSIFNDRDDLILVDAYDVIVNMSDGTKNIYPHKAYIAKVGSDGNLTPYTPTADETVQMYIETRDIS